MRAYFGKEIAGIFEEILCDLYYDPDYVASPRGMEVREIRDCSMEIENPMENMYINEYRSSVLKYLSSEILWYFSGTNNPSYIENYASMWKNLHNSDGTVNSAYGNLLFTEKNEHNLTQYEWVIRSLKKDKDSRQAFMHFNKPQHQYFGNKDQVCTLQALFHIRDNKLHMTLTMRSNDVVLGFMTDFTFFSVLQYQVFLHLKKYYPEIEMGSYTHISHSMHLYEKHYDLVKNMLTKSFEPNSLPLSNTPIIDETGKFLKKYEDIFLPITQGKIPEFRKNTNNIKEGDIYSDWEIKTDNDLLNWCISKL